MPNAAQKILIVDDHAANLSFVFQFLEQQGFSVVTAADGESALELFVQERPDLVLMDIMLPDSDGRVVTRRIKELTGDRWVPVIYMTALAGEADHVRGLEAGGDDYITKPVNLRILRARIDAMQRIAHTRRALEQTTMELRHYQTRAEQETARARELMEKLIYQDRLNDPMLRVWHEPAARFSGDLIAATRSTADRLYIMVADSTGHGLTAALPLLQLAQIFYAMAERGFSLATIVQEMNNKTLARMPADRFVCAVLAIADPGNRTLELWCGGMPAPIFISDTGECLHRFEPRHPPLGLEAPESFDASTEVFMWSEVGNLVIYSDGLIEAQNSDQQNFDESALYGTLRGRSLPQQFDALQRAVKQHVGDCPAHDDISLLMVQCQGGRKPGAN